MKWTAAFAFTVSFAIVASHLYLTPNRAERVKLAETFTAQAVSWTNKVHLTILGVDCDHVGSCTVVLESGVPVAVQCERETEICHLNTCK